MPENSHESCTFENMAYLLHVGAMEIKAGISGNGVIPHTEPVLLFCGADRKQTRSQP